ncbi:MAG: hypothetical protein U0412_02390 [Nitrospira sp.]
MSFFPNTDSTSRYLCSVLFLAGLLIGATADPPTADAASTLYWCPDRKADQQYSAKPGPGCSPLAESKAPATDSDDRSLAPERESKNFKIDNLQHDVSEFLTRYRHFLDCCKTDLSELRQVEELGNEVGDLLLSVQAQMSNHSLASRGVMLREMIPPVAKARADLRTLRAKLEQIGDSMRQHESADLEQAGREAQTIRTLQDSIDRDIIAPNLPGGPKTGAAIGSAPTAGSDIGKTPKTGAAIGSEGKTGQDIGASPRSGGDIGGSGPSGFAIGNTGRAGPSIGESDLNSENSSNVGSSLQRSSVGSSLSDSSIGSSLGSSSIGSSLQDTSVGSSFGGSSVGSSLQNRGTGR